MRNIILFLLISLASGWLGVWIDKSIEPQAEGNSLGMGVWLLLPFSTLVFLRFLETNTWKFLA